MRKQHLRQILWSLAAGAAIGAGLTQIAIARADTTLTQAQQDLIAVMQAQGIAFNDQTVGLQAAEVVCSNVRQAGVSQREETDAYAQETDTDAITAAITVSDMLTILCPAFPAEGTPVVAGPAGPTAAPMPENQPQVAAPKIGASVPTSKPDVAMGVGGALH